MTKKTSQPMMNERTEVSKVVVVYRGWQALTLWEMVFLAMLRARGVGRTQRAMRQLIHSPMQMEKQLTLPEETRE